VVEVRAILPASPEAVWGVLTDLDGMPDWRRDLSRLERLPERSGHLVWLEVQGGKALALERIEAQAPIRLVIRPAVAPWSRRWVYQLKPAGRGTEIAVREERWIANPLVRPFVVVFGGGRGRIGKLARDLERRLSGRALVAG
jgi:hypothetical protein